MSTDRDVTRIVRSWLEEGTTALPDRVLDNVLDQLPATSQRRAWWRAWRLNEMNNVAKVAMAATAVVVIVAVIRITVMPGSGDVGGSPAVLMPTPALTPTPGAATPIPTSTPEPTCVSPSASSAGVVHGWPGSRGGPAGRYSWDPDGRAAQEDLPNGGVFGWMHNLSSHLEVTFGMSDDTYGPGPIAVTVSGYDATYQEVPVNSEGVLKHHVWIVDIDGTPVTITVTSISGASVADLAEGNAIVDSIRVERTTTSTGFRLTFALQTGWDSG
jgi:hypothetical protein